ncbi:tRNA (adenosine(37)-N6)-threonylcarbamoyltransferase complex ATPase subunit type 1 TsaE [Sphingomonas alba]|uniref:tRNA threonylcarbamoyladenosine biosynthesis protein TsaE n=1 Tax=Sphingomonas alba TaxID=2908208 RepID=A0ABT0RII6_9SPHN|nr:tRNA (adenosine(37)-N6)-threonylcarbamoyltransferase complex ATPase subunit type 1 TsaE [Sphingomonas alba]MCL6682449.1 tRNA (adenosine(37)-N6)-threonylcarbamoyltransferase complex ATPase subunit type 1 TsaE [Sphingomonas alba]
MILEDEAATVAVGKALASQLRPGDVVAMTGDLGAGKTTLVRGLLHALGHDGEVPSPSFAIVQPYEDLDPPVWHADLYRVENPAELAELGLDSLGDGILIVEWPERVGEGAWPDALRLSLEILDPQRRRLTAEVPAAWEGRWPPQ